MSSAVELPAQGPAHEGADDSRPAPAAAGQKPEGRRAPRKTTCSGAVLRFDSSRPQMPVTVHDISATGARVQLLTQVKPVFGEVSRFPADFKLVIPNDRIEVDCKLAWERGSEIGVLFLSAFRPIRMVAKRPTFAKRG